MNSSDSTSQLLDVIGKNGHVIGCTLLPANKARNHCCPVDIYKAPGPGAAETATYQLDVGFQGSTPQQLLSHNMADRGLRSSNSSRYSMMQNHAFPNDVLISSGIVMESGMMNSSRKAQPQLSSDTTSLLLRWQQCQGHSSAGCGTVPAVSENVALPLQAMHTCQPGDCATIPGSDPARATWPEQDESALIDILLEYGLQVAMAEAVAELRASPPWSTAVHPVQPPEDALAIATAAAPRVVGLCSGKTEGHMAAAAGPYCQTLSFYHHATSPPGQQVTSTRAGDDAGAGQQVVRVQLAANCSAGDGTPPVSGAPLLDGHQEAKDKDEASKVKLLPVTSSAGLTSKYRGVCWNKRNRRWQASINHAGRYVYLGSYIDEVDAARQFDLAAVHMRGPKKAKLNFPVTDYIDISQQLLDNAAH